MGSDVSAVSDRQHGATATSDHANALFADSISKLQNKDFVGAKKELDDCVKWGQQTKTSGFLANSLWLRGITEVDLQPAGKGSKPAEDDFKAAADIAKTLPNFDLVRFAELEQERGTNLKNLGQLPQALKAFKDGSAGISKSPDLINVLSPATNKQVELLYDVGTTDNQTGNYKDAVTNLTLAATIVRKQLRAQPNNTSADFQNEQGKFGQVIRELKTSYDGQGMDGLAQVTELIKNFEAGDKTAASGKS